MVNPIKGVGEVHLEHVYVAFREFGVGEGIGKELCVDVCVIPAAEARLAGVDNAAGVRVVGGGPRDHFGPQFEEGVGQAYGAVVAEVGGLPFFVEQDRVTERQAGGEKGARGEVAEEGVNRL